MELSPVHTSCKWECDTKFGVNLTSQCFARVQELSNSCKTFAANCSLQICDFNIRIAFAGSMNQTLVVAKT